MTPELLDAIRRLAGGDLAARVALPEGEGEAADLARAFNEMADALEARVTGAERRVGDLVARQALVTSRSLAVSLKGSVDHIQRLLVEHELHLRDACLRQIADGVREVFWLSDVEDGRVLYVNRAYEALWGQSPESLEAAPGSWMDAVHPDDAPAVREAVAAAAAGEGGEPRFRLVRPDGTVRWVSAHFTPVVDEQGVIARVAVVAADVTERVEAAEESRRARARLDAILAASPTVLYTFAIEGDRLPATWVSENVVRVTGHELSDVVAPGWWLDHLHPDDREAGLARMRALFETGSLVHEYRLRHRSGTYRWIRDELKVLRDDAGAPREVVGSWADVTEEREALEQLERAREASMRRERLVMMGELLAGVAHELNNPLAVVGGHATLLERALAGGPLAPRAGKIVESATRCARIVKNFLTLARQQPPERSQVRLNAVVKGAVELVAYGLRVDEVEVRLALADDLPLLSADLHQLQQVVVNLLTNAHHALRQSAPPRGLTITTRHGSAAGRVSLEVADTGPGIAPEVQARIFEPFFTTKAAGEGTGLGLPICLGIVESHGGTMRVESAPGQGTTFVVELPVGTAPDRVRVERAAPAAVPPQVILVVDDEPDVADVAAEALRLHGHDVDTASNGVEALAKLAGRSYGLVLTDVRMPGLDGPGLWREVQRVKPELARRFVFLTGDTLSPESRDFLERAGLPSVAKPFTVEDLLAAVARALGPRPG